MAGLTIASLDWGNRNPNQFIDAAVQSTDVLKMFTLIDGVKSKYQFPKADASLTFGTDVCVFDPQSSANIDEKEMTVSTYKWAFKNCKNVLQNSYRSLLLKKGMNNPETMDSAFKDWVFEYFAKLSGQKILELSASEIRTEILADANVVKPAASANSLTSEATILDDMKAAYKSLPKSQLEQLMGVADREFKPAFFVNANVYRAYQLAIAAAEKNTYDGTKLGLIETFLGMEVHLWATLTDQEMILTAPNNLVMLTDDYSDVEAIQATYKPELSSDYLWGQFTIGFSYKVSEDIVYYTGA
jgi:hypothetical protein